jgi:hypothetical protein
MLNRDHGRRSCRQQNSAVSWRYAASSRCGRPEHIYVPRRILRQAVTFARVIEPDGRQLRTVRVATRHNFEPGCSRRRQAEVPRCMIFEVTSIVAPSVSRPTCA